eukprot:TRINITY_DN13063_c2_g1_i1.p1 TRINITY_DN13063_c2_g1~~TRINITY_DN13063_c2_g1_i1.p1  ORF type:complete len:313 (-),score=35.48 TRINITY_DN13063_c2_g1_i1:253-1191(-)
MESDMTKSFLTHLRGVLRVSHAVSHYSFIQLSLTELQRYAMRRTTSLAAVILILFCEPFAPPRWTSRSKPYVQTSLISLDVAAPAVLQGKLRDIDFPGRYPGSKPEVADFKRFLDVQGGNLPKAEAMARHHVEWREATFPIIPDRTVQMLLASGRCGQVVAWNGKNEPIVMFDWKWGHLLDGGVSTDQFISCFLTRIESVLSEMEERKSHKWCWLSIGGPPPLELGTKLSHILDDHYPDLLRLAVIAPIPATIKRIADSMLYFLPKRMQEKFKLASTGQEVAEVLGCDMADLPLRVQEIENEKGKALLKLAY